MAKDAAVEEKATKKKDKVEGEEEVISELPQDVIECEIDLSKGNRQVCR